VLVRTRGHLLLYDTGPQYSPESDAGSRVLLPLLRARGERRVDMLVLSHRDTDHIGGAAALLAGIDVLASTSSLAPDHPLLMRLPAHRHCEAGMHWNWDGVRFEMVHPLAGDHDGASKPNAVSCVLAVTDAQDRRLLLTADIEAEQEAALVRRLGRRLASRVLLVPHHGSRTSSSPAFLEAASPRVAVVQAAYRSRFGHPAPDVMARYRERGIEIVRNDECGAWSWAPGDGDAGRCERKERRRYWHHAVSIPP
jgi:competence protein ComEC